MHIPVLQKEVIQYLNPKPNQNFIDATLDGGGHSALILEKTNPNGKILGIELEEKLIDEAKVKIINSGISIQRLIAVKDNFRNLKNIVKSNNFHNIKGILFDLGISSWHFEQSGRGFSFRFNEPLDMRMDIQNTDITAEDIVNSWPQKKIEEILRKYGEERYARSIARKITICRRTRKIETTFDLERIVREAVPLKYLRQKIHPATKTFLALRIFVNNELDNLKEGLRQSIDILTKGGRLVVISFHSLEDRVVKNFLRNQTKKGNIELLTKKPIMPSSREITENPRSRSAKLRAAQKL